MAIGRRESRGVVVLSLRGNFYGDTETEALQKAIAEEAAAGNLRLVLNLAECQTLNSIAIGTLMRGFVTYRGKNGEIKLCCLNKRITDLFTMTKLIKVFDLHDAEDDAVAAFAVEAR
jgi:anti-sigma B factor antagonist